MSDEVVQVIDRAAQQTATDRSLGLVPDEATQVAAQSMETQPVEEAAAEEQQGDFFPEDKEASDAPVDPDLEEVVDPAATATYDLDSDDDFGGNTLVQFEGKDFNKAELRKVFTAARREGSFRNEIKQRREAEKGQNEQMVKWQNYVGGVEALLSEALKYIPVQEYNPMHFQQWAEAGYTNEQVQQMVQQNENNKAIRQQFIQATQQLKEHEPQLTEEERQTSIGNAVGAALELGSDNDAYYELSDKKTALKTLNSLGHFMVSKGMTNDQVAVVYANLEPAHLSIFLDAYKWNTRIKSKQAALREPARQAAAPASTNFRNMTDEQLQRYATKKGYEGNQLRSFLNRNWNPTMGPYTTDWLTRSALPRG